MRKGRISVFVMVVTLTSIGDSFGHQLLRGFRPCWRPRRGCCACSRCCRRGGTGPAASWPTAWTSRCDVDRLRDLGYPVTATQGAAGGYRLEAGAAMPPLLL